MVALAGVAVTRVIGRLLDPVSPPKVQFVLIKTVDVSLSGALRGIAVGVNVAPGCVVNGVRITSFHAVADINIAARICDWNLDPVALNVEIFIVRCKVHEGLLLRSLVLLNRAESPVSDLSDGLSSGDWVGPLEESVPDFLDALDDVLRVLETTWASSINHGLTGASLGCEPVGQGLDIFLIAIASSNSIRDVESDLDGFIPSVILFTVDHVFQKTDSSSDSLLSVHNTVSQTFEPVQIDELSEEGRDELTNVDRIEWQMSFVHKPIVGGILDLTEVHCHDIIVAAKAQVQELSKVIACLEVLSIVSMGVHACSGLLESLLVLRAVDHERLSHFNRVLEHSHDFCEEGQLAVEVSLVAVSVRGRQIFNVGLLDLVVGTDNMTIAEQADSLSSAIIKVDHILATSLDSHITVLRAKSDQGSSRELSGINSHAECTRLQSCGASSGGSNRKCRFHFSNLVCFVTSMCGA